MTAHNIAPRPSSLVKPQRDRKYLAWLRTQPCIVCLIWPTASQPIEAAHTGQAGAGMGQKASDLDAVPLCRKCHGADYGWGYHNFGNEAQWADFHALDLPVIRAALQRRYTAETKREVKV